MPLTGTADTRNLTPAKIELLEPGQEPGRPGPLIKELKFQLNPRELTMAKTAKWEKKNQKKASSAPPASYQGPDPQKLTVEMYFDASLARDNSVVTQVEELFKATAPTEKSKGTKTPSPPWVRFMWGGLSGFVGYITSVSAKYTLFAPSGQPLRAVCTVAMEELASEMGKQNPTSGGLQPRRLHVVREGDTLAAIAFREYGRASLWRAVADVNGIDDPMRLRPGRSILLPAAEEFDAPLEPVRRELARALG
ncbi:LysM peptidoglycan-binding domain-containing protein [Agromyces sp. CFH 90414]|uniref:LysM peptidoglycan-binding domain-containing protein n=1 Tax=Agromyces agglutinans TaxID=2662258 RepID=A0A6I2F716_9MICO|nr:LysM peptidoglycan-binding domain-containing protein [Agromyces agglutinans]MRG59567.1 LysM peptidoglycan-binding domain-containing protein [Agromyces agglutinans]